jgi:hypothetical protein
MEKIKKHKSIPKISEKRLDFSPANLKIGTSKKDIEAERFIKKRESKRVLTLRLSEKLYKDLREYAFKFETKMTHIITQALEERLKNK